MQVPLNHLEWARSASHNLWHFVGGLLLVLHQQLSPHTLNHNSLKATYERGRRLTVLGIIGTLSLQLQLASWVLLGVFLCMRVHVSTNCFIGELQMIYQHSVNRVQKSVDKVQTFCGQGMDVLWQLTVVTCDVYTVCIFPSGKHTVLCMNTCYFCCHSQLHPLPFLFL